MSSPTSHLVPSLLFCLPFYSCHHDKAASPGRRQYLDDWLSHHFNCVVVSWPNASACLEYQGKLNSSVTLESKCKATYAQTQRCQLKAKPKAKPKHKTKLLFVLAVPKLSVISFLVRSCSNCARALPWQRCS